MRQEKQKEVLSLEKLYCLSYLPTLLVVGFLYKLVRKSTYWLSSILRL